MDNFFKAAFDKTALTITNRFNRYARPVATGSLIGSILGASVGNKYNEELSEKDRKGSKAVPIMTAIGGLTGGILGGKLRSDFLKSKLDSMKFERLLKHRRNQYKKRSDEFKKKWKESFGKSWEEAFSSRFGHSSGRKSSYTNSNSGSNYNKSYDYNNTIHINHLRKMGLNAADIKTKSDLKKAFRDIALKHHPDRGGSHEKMQDINNAFDELKKTSWFDKLAFFRGFNGTKN